MAKDVVVLALSPNVTDEHCVPMSLYAAARLLDARLDQQGIRDRLGGIVTNHEWKAPATLRMTHALLGTLIENNEGDASIFLWAGSLAETAGANAEAEANYIRATELGGQTTRLAPLYLARLYFNLNRSEEAIRLLKQHLDRFPEDAAARALLALQEPNARPQQATGGSEQ